MVYTVGDSLKFGDVGLGSTAVLGCKCVALGGADREGDNGEGMRLLRESWGTEQIEAPNVVVVGVRAGLRSGIEGTNDALAKDARVAASSAPVCSVPMMSWYQSYDRKLKLGLGGGRSKAGSCGALLSSLFSVLFLFRRISASKPSSDDDPIVDELPFRGYGFISISEFLLLGA